MVLSTPSPYLPPSAFNFPKIPRKTSANPSVGIGGGFWLYLDEADVGGLLTEALTADVEAVFADQTGLVGADAAVRSIVSYGRSFLLQIPATPPSDRRENPSNIMERTSRGSPCRSCGGASSRQIRETYWRLKLCWFFFLAKEVVAGAEKRGRPGRVVRCWLLLLLCWILEWESSVPKVDGNVGLGFFLHRRKLCGLGQCQSLPKGWN